MADEWEHITMVIEISDPYWDAETGGPEVYHRTAKDNETLYLNHRSKEGWELVSLMPAKSIAGMPEEFRSVGDPKHPHLQWNTYVGFFKRKKNR